MATTSGGTGAGFATPSGVSRPRSTRLTGVGIEGDILYGPEQVRELVRTAREAGVEATYREIRSTKGHDAFLVEWDQLAPLVAGQVAAS